MKVVELPMQLVSLANARGHWAKKARRAKQERETAMLVTPADLVPPIHVKLVRIAPRKFDDDNLQSAFKSIRDGIAKKCNVNDGSAAISFVYAQEKSKKPREHSVRIEFSGKRLGAV